MGDDRSKQVYIGYLPNDARMEDVEEFFKGFLNSETFIIVMIYYT